MVRPPRPRGHGECRTDVRVLHSYSQGTEESSGPVLPFHWCCFEILTRTLTGSTDTQNLNLDVLYHIMATLSNGSSSALQLSYGDDIRRAQGRYWECIPGAEASYTGSGRDTSQTNWFFSTARPTLQISPIWIVSLKAV